MADNIQLSDLYTLFLDALNEVLLPPHNGSNNYLMSVAYCLEDLESDSYSFLYRENVKKLIEGGFIPQSIAEPVEAIRRNLLELPKEFWTPEAFCDDAQWQRIRVMAVSVLRVIPGK